MTGERRVNLEKKSKCPALDKSAPDASFKISPLNIDQKTTKREMLGLM